MDIERKTVLITGGSSGIGKQIAILFASNNYSVIIVGRDENKLKDVSSISNNIKYDVCDLENQNDIVKMLNSINNIDILINCAGTINSIEEKEEYDLDSLNKVIDINLKASISTSLLAIEKMIKNDIKGVIINIGSIVAKNGSKFFPIYSASKGGIVSFTKSIAARFGEHGIRCNIISPGVIKTPMSYIETPNFDDYIDSIEDKTPLKRLGNPSDVAELALFLAGGNSSFITGQEIIVDGGYTLSQE